VWGFIPTLIAWSLFGIFVGCASTSFTMLVQTVLQRESDPAMLGRVMSLFTIGFFGTTPLGALLAGVLISTFDARWPFVAGGIVTLAAAAYALFWPLPSTIDVASGAVAAHWDDVARERYRCSARPVRMRLPRTGRIPSRQPNCTVSSGYPWWLGSQRFDR
jgi:MFS family permease